MNMTAKEVLEQLNRLSNTKKTIKKPIRLEKEGPVFHIYDADGLLVISLTRGLYEMFQEL